jgi:uncharacterized membrane protein YuzA (DUF378 family)
MSIFTTFSQTLGPNDVQNLPTPTAGAVLASGLNIVYLIAGIAAVIVIILSGIKYTTSGGDSGAVASAKNTLLYAIVGLVVVILAFTITQFVIGRF